MFLNKDYSNGKLILKNCNVADTRNLRVIRNVDILLESGKIATVSRFDSDSVDAQIISAAGHTVTPGLIDAHVHLCLSGEPNCHEKLDELGEEGLRAVMCESLNLNLQNGITTVRDLGSPWDMLVQLRQLESTDIAAPTVFAAGPVCTIPGGHAIFFGEVIYPPQTKDMFSKLTDFGADWVKLVGTGGNLSPTTQCDETQYSDKDFSAIVSAAADAGFDVACHAHATEGIRQCLSYGVRSIEHGSYMSAEQVSALSQMENCYWVTTTCPGRLIKNLSEASTDRVLRRRANIKLSVKEGAKLIAGTDAGIGGVPHGVLAYEIDEFIDGGMSALKALRSATHLTAIMMRCEGKIGVIEDGADADILLLKGDIEEDGFAFHDPAAIIKGGRLIKGL